MSYKKKTQKSITNSNIHPYVEIIIKTISSVDKCWSIFTHPSNLGKDFTILSLLQTSSKSVGGEKHCHSIPLEGAIRLLWYQILALLTENLPTENSEIKNDNISNRISLN